VENVIRTGKDQIQEINSTQKIKSVIYHGEILNPLFTLDSLNTQRKRTFIGEKSGNSFIKKTNKEVIFHVKKIYDKNLSFSNNQSLNKKYVFGDLNYLINKNNSLAIENNIQEITYFQKECFDNKTKLLKFNKKIITNSSPIKPQEATKFNLSSNDIIEIPIIDIVNSQPEKNDFCKKEESQHYMNKHPLKSKLKKPKNLNCIEDEMKIGQVKESNFDYKLLNFKRERNQSIFNEIARISENFLYEDVDDINIKKKTCLQIPTFEAELNVKKKLHEEETDEKTNLLNDEVFSNTLNSSKNDYYKKFEIVEGFDLEIKEVEKISNHEKYEYFEENLLYLKENGYIIDEITKNLDSNINEDNNKLPEGFETNLNMNNQKNYHDDNFPYKSYQSYLLIDLFNEFLQKNYKYLGLNLIINESIDTLQNKFNNFIYMMLNDPIGMQQLKTIVSSNNYSIFFHNFLQMNFITSDPNFNIHNQTILFDNNYNFSQNKFIKKIYKNHNQVNNNIFKESKIFQVNDDQNITQQNKAPYKNEINMINIKQNFITSNYHTLQNIENPIFNNYSNHNFNNNFNVNSQNDKHNFNKYTNPNQIYENNPINYLANKKYQNNRNSNPISINYSYIGNQNFGNTFISKKPFNNMHNYTINNNNEENYDFSEILCYQCKKRGHISNDCPEMQCYVCKNIGHISNRCPKILCFICNQVGHVSYRCPDSICYNCNNKGHFANRCPENDFEVSEEFS